MSTRNGRGKILGSYFSSDNCGFVQMPPLSYFSPVVVSQTDSFRSFKVVTFRQTLFQTFDDDIPGDKNNLMVLLASSRIKSPL